MPGFADMMRKRKNKKKDGADNAETEAAEPAGTNTESPEGAPVDEDINQMQSELEAAAGELDAVIGVADETATSEPGPAPGDATGVIDSLVPVIKEALGYQDAGAQLVAEVVQKMDKFAGKPPEEVRAMLEDYETLKEILGKVAEMSDATAMAEATSPMGDAGADLDALLGGMQ